MDAITHRVDHVQFHHRLSQRRIAIAARGLVALNVFVRQALEEAAFVLEHQPVRQFRHDHATIAGVILVSDAVVQGLQHDPLVVLGYLDGQQLVLRQQPKLDVADTLVQARRAQQKRRAEMLVGAFLPFELPRQLRRMGRQAPGRFGLAEKQQRGAAFSAICIFNACRRSVCGR